MAKLLCQSHYNKLRLHGSTYGAPVKPPAENYRTSAEIRTRILKINFERRQSNKAYWVAKLGGKCEGCGTDDIRVLTFDHIDPTLKARNISALMVRADRDDETLVEEMGKCQILCANCHMIKTRENGDSGRKRVYYA